MPYKFINVINVKPKALFLVDCLGALLSAILYLLVLANYNDFFGLPAKELNYLGFLAIIYTIYSFTCYAIYLNFWQPFMKAIAIANLVHCCITIFLIFYYAQQITIWGILYFAGELIIVIPLAIWELKIATRKSQHV